MLQDLLTLLPSWSGTAAIVIALAGVVAGLGLWLAGARFSRQLVSLILTAVGAGVGHEMPRWLSLNMSGAGTAVAGAVILGVLGFLMHRFWIGILLGTVMALWAALATWAVLHQDKPLTWPEINGDTKVVDAATDLWKSLPEDVTRIMPFAAGIALVSGVCLALLWPRVATVLNWSLVGVSMLVVMGIVAITILKPEWRLYLPAQTWAQLTAFFGLIAFGAIVQWRLSPKASAKKSPAKSEAPAT